MNVYEAINSRRTVRDFQDRTIGQDIIERIIDAGLKAPSNDHLRNWEFVIVNDKEKRRKLLKLEDLKDREKCDELLDAMGMTDEIQRNMYHEAMPRQFSMLYNAGCLILPFLKIRQDLLKPTSLSSLNPLAAIWCCIENMLIAAAAEGIFGVTCIPMTEEPEHIKSVVGNPDDYVLPCYLALGYPAENAVRPLQKKISVKDKIHYSAW